MVADDNLIVARLRLRENGRMTVCLSRVSYTVCSKRRRGGRGRYRADAPLSIVSEDCVRLTEREELFPGLRLFVHVRVKLLTQLQSQKTKYREVDSA